MKNKVLMKIVLPVSLVLFFYILNSSNQVKFVLRNIQMDFKGIIVDKYTVREGVYPTFLKVRVNDKNIDIDPLFQILHFADVGDSIIKIKDENICYVVKKNGMSKKFFYVSISRSQRDDKKFPKEWKDKWMGSTILLDSFFDNSTSSK